MCKLCMRNVQTFKHYCQPGLCLGPVDILAKVRYNTYIATKEHTMRDAILAKLAEVEEMLLEATLDGEQLAELSCFADLTDPLSTLVQAVDYYVD